MFDWNDEEFTDIVWGEASENDDHIVPYPKGGEEKPLVQCGIHNNKQWSKEDTPIKHAEQKKLGASNDLSGCKLESNSQFSGDGLSALEMDSWPDSPLPTAASSKEYAARTVQDAMDTAGIDNDTQLFGGEYEKKEHVDFLDYTWANIGTFDDLDRIFRNDDPIFGHENLGKGDELWLSSKDVLSSPRKSSPISTGSPGLNVAASRNTSEQYEMEKEFVRLEDQPSGCERTSALDSHLLLNVDANKDDAGTGSWTILIPSVQSAGGKSKFLMEEKVTWQREPLKYPKTVDEREKKSQNLRGACFLDGNKVQLLGNQLQTSSLQTFPSSVLSPRRQLGGPQSSKYMQTSHPFLLSGYGNPINHYPVVPMWPHVNSDKNKDQSALSGYSYTQLSPKNLNPVEKIPDVYSRPTTMTPREKIEKLRRRQQMQAMLAIQEQQQQLGHQVTATDYSSAQSCPRVSQSQDTEGSIIEVEENIKVPASSRSNQDDSNMITMSTDDCSLEERALDQLQDVIGKLDMSIRLCIRDSLFRLARSASQRHNSNDTRSTNKCMDKHEVIIKEEEESGNRSTKIADAEKETNPIDRTMVHLLFLPPLQSSSTKPLKDYQLKESTKHKTEGSMNGTMGCLSDDLTDKQRPPNTPWMVAVPYNVNQFQNNDYANTPENTRNSEQDAGGNYELLKPCNEETLLL